MKIRLRMSLCRKIKTSDIVLFWMWWYMIITPICVYWMKFPRIILYIGDVVGCGVFCLIMQDILSKKHKTYIKGFTILIIMIFIIFGTMSAVVNVVNPLYYLWGLRNCGRFFLFFCASAMYLNIDDFMKTRKIIKAIFWISVPLCFYETYFISYPTGTIIGDMIGGIYHGFNGVTMALNIILVLEAIDILDDYFHNNVKVLQTVATLVAAVLMSGWAELKIFIVELLIIVITLMLISKKSIKTIFIVVLCILAFSYIITFFTDVNARGRTTYGDIFTIEGFIEYISRDSGYDGVGDLNRLSGISTLNKGLFKGDIIQHIIGNGIGSAEYTSFFSSPFYIQNSYTHYSWFQMIWVYIENGYIGIISIILFIISQLIDSFKSIKDTWLRNYSVTVLILLPVLFMYNVTLRSEVVGFYLYFVMALPCLYRKEKYINKKEKNMKERI